MADLNLSIPTGEVSLTASTAKTVVTAKAPANQRLKLKGIEVFFKGTSPTDTPVKIEVNRVTTDGGTATTVTPAAADDDLTETPQGTYRSAYTVEPTTYGANLKTWEVHPQTGLIVYFPLHDEPKIKGGNILGVRMTAAQSQTVSCNLVVEE